MTPLVVLLGGRDRVLACDAPLPALQAVTRWPLEVWGVDPPGGPYDAAYACAPVDEARLGQVRAVLTPDAVACFAGLAPAVVARHFKVVVPFDAAWVPTAGPAAWVYAVAPRGAPRAR